MLQTKYSKWLLIHQYLLSVFIPFHRSKKSQIIIKNRPLRTVITLLKIKNIVQILSHSRMGEDLCFEVGIRNLIVNRHSNQVNQLL